MKNSTKATICEYLAMLAFGSPFIAFYVFLNIVAWAFFVWFYIVIIGILIWLALFAFFMGARDNFLGRKDE